MSLKITPAMADVLRQIDAGKSPYDLMHYSAFHISRLINACSDTGLVQQPRGKRQLTDAGRAALQQWENKQ